MLSRKYVSVPFEMLSLGDYPFEENGTHFFYLMLWEHI